MALGSGLQPRRLPGGVQRRPGGSEPQVPSPGARAAERWPLPGPMGPLARLRLPPPGQGPFLPPLAGSPTAARVWAVGTARLLQRSDPRASPRRAPPPRGAAGQRAKLSLLLLRPPPPPAQPGLGAPSGHCSPREGSSEAAYYSEKRIWEWISQVNRSLFAPSGVPGPLEQDKSIRIAYRDNGGLLTPSPGIRECRSRKGRSTTPSFDRRGN